MIVVAATGAFLIAYTALLSVLTKRATVIDVEQDNDPLIKSGAITEKRVIRKRKPWWNFMFPMYIEYIPLTLYSTDELSQYDEQEKCNFTLVTNTTRRIVERNKRIDLIFFPPWERTSIVCLGSPDKTLYFKDFVFGEKIQK